MGGVKSTGPSVTPLHSTCLSNILNQVSTSSLCSKSKTSSRTAGLRWNLEQDIYDGASVKDFVQHVFHVPPEHITAILLEDWHPDAELLKHYESILSTSQDSNQRSAFETLVANVAQRISKTIDGNFDAQTLSAHLRSTFVSITHTPLIESNLKKPESGADRQIKNPPNSGLSVRPITPADLQLIAHAAETLNAPECHYTTCISVEAYSLTLWYYDRTCMVRTIEFDFRHQPIEFALFAHGISHNIKKPSLKSESLQLPLEDSVQASFTMADTKLTIRPDTSRQHDAIFTNINTIYARPTLIGRGTKVFAVTLDSFNGNCTDEYVLKMVWPNISRTPETELVTAIIAAVPQWQAYLPQIAFSATFSADQLLPRTKLLTNLPYKPLYDRYLHVMAMLKYRKLWEVDTVKEFQDVYVDCVECHFHSYEEGKVLHCDLSENNLMYRRDSGHVKGVLNDWDLGSPVDNNGDVLTPTKSYPVGTIPFMAYDLLGETTPAHLYRHDLESFLYILVWAAVHYDFTTKQKIPVVTSLAAWDHESFRVARQAKGAFLFDPCGTSTIFQDIRKEFRNVLDEWIVPLHSLFSSAIRSTSEDIRTFDGRITFQTFMKVIGRKPR